MTKFWVKNTIILSVLAFKKILYLFKKEIIYNFMIFVDRKNGIGQKKFVTPPLLVLLLDQGSGIRDPGWIKIRIRDQG
jgi:hypothetical protein